MAQVCPDNVSTKAANTGVKREDDYGCYSSDESSKTRAYESEECCQARHVPIVPTDARRADLDSECSSELSDVGKAAFRMLPIFTLDDLPNTSLINLLSPLAERHKGG